MQYDNLHSDSIMSSNCTQSELEEPIVVLTEVNRLTTGQYFGEQALSKFSKDKIRNATIKSMHDEVVVAVLSDFDYDRVLAKCFEKSLNRTFQFLRSSPIFQKASRAMLNARRWELTTFYKDRQIVTEGQRHPYFYIIRTGSVEVTRKVWKNITAAGIEDARLETEKEIIKDKTHLLPPPSPETLQRDTQ